MANYVSNNISVINGAANTVLTTISVGTPSMISVNAITNRVYVGHNSGTQATEVTVIDGNTNTIVNTIPVVGNLNRIAVNSSTNRIYVVHAASNGKVTVIDGNTNAVMTTISVGSFPYDLAVNATTNRIYVANYLSNTISVINGANNTVIATIPRSSPYHIAVNATTNRIYVSDLSSPVVSVIDGGTNATIASMVVSFSPSSLSVNTSANRIYVRYSGMIQIIDGSTNSNIATIILPSNDSRGMGVRTVNSDVSRIYVSNSNNTVTIIEDRNSCPPNISDLQFALLVNNQQPIPNPVGNGAFLTFTANIKNTGTQTRYVQSAALSWINQSYPSESLASLLWIQGSPVPDGKPTTPELIWTNRNYPIQPGANLNFEFNFKVKRSGNLSFTFTITDDLGATALDTSELDIPVTYINFPYTDSEGKYIDPVLETTLSGDPRIRSLVFWMLYNETIRDTMEDFDIQNYGSAANIPVPTLRANTDFLKTVPYCNPNSTNPAKNDKGDEQPGNWIVGDDGYTVDFVTHCDPPDFRYIQTQALINSFINAERSNQQSITFVYVLNNFGGSMANEDYVFWQDHAGCYVLDSNGNPTSNPLPAYSDIVDGEKDPTTNKTVLTFNPETMLNWLHSYLYCRVKTPQQYEIDAGQAALYDKAYRRLMPSIQSAFDAFYATPNTEDYSNNAVAIKNAALSFNGLEDSFKVYVGGDSHGYVKAFNSITQSDIETSYPDFIAALQGRNPNAPYGDAGYDATAPTVLRPVLVSERNTIIVDKKLRGFQYVGYKWVMVAYQQPITPLLFTPR